MGEPKPDPLTVIWYFSLCLTFRALRGMQHTMMKIVQWMDKPMEFVHRPVRVLSARYMSFLVNGK